jgi:hypothetical protein
MQNDECGMMNAQSFPGLVWGVADPGVAPQFIIRHSSLVIIRHSSFIIHH